MGLHCLCQLLEHKDYKKLLDDLNKAQVSIPIISNGLIENPSFLPLPLMATQEVLLQPSVLINET